MIHTLKTTEPYFSAVRSGMKNFEVRKNDRPYEVGDILHLKRYPEKKGTPTLVRRVQYILADPRYVIPGYIIMGIMPWLKSWSVAFVAMHPNLLKTAIFAWRLNYMYGGIFPGGNYANTSGLYPPLKNLWRIHNFLITLKVMTMKLKSKLNYIINRLIGHKFSCPYCKKTYRRKDYFYNNCLKCNTHWKAIFRGKFTRA